MNPTPATNPTRKIIHWKKLGVAAGSLALLLAATGAQAQEYTTRVVATGLHRPTGIVAGPSEDLYFSEVPSPGVPGAGNAVKMLDLEENRVTTLHEGEPEPTNLALDRHGNLYWTCKSAGVILEQDSKGVTTKLLTGLQKPSGVALDRRGNVYFTQLPTPGVPAPAGGKNSVSVFNGTVTTVLHQGEPEPTDIAAGQRGEIYWTCKTAGVILTQDVDGKTSLVLNGLNKPVGIALNRRGTKLYWTEVPTPGVAGSKGGLNKVWELDLRTKVKTLVHSGDPEPTDITVNREGTLYWTCSSAGVIVEAKSARRAERDDE